MFCDLDITYQGISIQIFKKLLAKFVYYKLLLRDEVISKRPIQFI